MYNPHNKNNSNYVNLIEIIIYLYHGNKIQFMSIIQTCTFHWNKLMERLLKWITNCTKHFKPNGYIAFQNMEIQIAHSWI